MREWLWNGGPIDYSRPWHKVEWDNGIYCENCEEEITNWEQDLYGGLCSDCYINSALFEKTINMENAMKCDNTEVEIPDFFAFVYTESEIKDILLEEFSKFPAEKRDEYIRGYALEDISDWAERTKKNG